MISQTSSKFISAAQSTLLLLCVQADAAPSSVVTGESARFKAREGSRQEMVYYVWDKDDGEIVPTARGFAEAVAPIDLHWFQPGSFQPTWRAVGLSGWVSDENPARLIEVTGETLQEPILPAGELVKTKVDGRAAWTLDLSDIHSVGDLLLVPSKNAAFPASFRVQYALSPDGPWYPIPSAVFPHFPDPAGRTVRIPLRGLMAGALRVLETTAARDESVSSSGLAGIRATKGSSAAFSGPNSVEDIAFWNNAWLVFGIAANEVHQRFDPWWETDRPLDGGMVCIGSCEWLNWGSQKLSWLGREHEQVRRLEEMIAGNPVGEDGIVWAAPNSPEHLGHSIHYVNNAIYPSAVARHFLMTRNREFLEMKDPMTGESVLSKARRAMDTLLTTLGGAEGGVTLPGPKTDGTPGSAGSNYWDFWLFGHRCAYTDGFFYESLRLMADLEESLGNADRARELRALRPKVKERFEKDFWNPETGRFIGWIDKEGAAYDYGFPFVNLQALAFGLGTPEQAESILAWLDGTRIIEGEDSTGADIYHFAFAPRTNTIDARHGTPPPVNTWNGALDLSPGGSAGYGLQIQNGGAIFYPAYYDLLARNRAHGPDAAAVRWRAIANEFHRDNLRRDPANNEGASDILGILREFPESGLVPLFFLDGILGLRPVAGGLLIQPSLPAAWPEATVRSFHFKGQPWQITARRDASTPVVSEGTVVVPATGAWLLTTDGKVLPHE